MKVLSFGEIVFDQIGDSEHLGGAPLNFAAHAQALGAESFMLSALGADDLATKALHQLQAWGINTSKVQQFDQYESGKVLVQLQAGQASYEILSPAAYDFISFDAQWAEEHQSDFELFYFGTLAQRNAQSQRALFDYLEHMQFKEVFFDCNLRQSFYSKEILQKSLQAASLFKLNDEELKILSLLLYNREQSEQDFCLALLQDYDLKAVILTAGSRGAYVAQATEWFFAPATRVEVEDTVGAGDAFSAAFCSNFLNGKDALSSLNAANRLGAFVASKRAAVPEIPADLKVEILG
ncbi:PfkB family carbohydrate kinase [Croceimicrobium hydrocarbonivorans]|uniref:Bifunctional hydroxymethylpyrimidine kinase/phosphomethylpyrimidine kinase n=1 Tax=Croceimicrobium hydrocarbonivorans TaxID=2761580 RepID=A0A7H0VAK6_9FLAO|nr:PfkB family carbohydrate kinase [Croceimicrobium hydrocarbonivorans]QNR22754.1 bifunctional hydroxymethylpyrimidine kinase/phosphomethylpyrimidine kinase [Croceimicrobium hydrocarbonivorans]